MKVLFIGGTGIISSASSQLAVDRGIDLYHLNRGESKSIRNIEGVKHIYANKWDFEETKKALGDHTFDAVVDWFAFEPSHIENDIKLFEGRTEQFIFISSASAYETPPKSLPVTESTPLNNPIWKYSQNKIACEKLLEEQYKKTGFPYTVVRPSHTYDKTLVPMEGGYTVLDRMKRGVPVVVHGDGSSIWTMTHHRDFAVGLVGILGNKKAIGEAFHITSSEWISWDEIYKTIGNELGVVPNIVHVPSDKIAEYDREIGDSLLGDKTHSMIFDNSKIKSFVPDFNPVIPFKDGAKEIVAWYNEHQNYQIVDKRIDSLFDKIIEDWA